MIRTRVVILGAGEVASGVAVRLQRCGFPLLLTEIAEPRAIRRLVSFSDAIYDGSHAVEEIRAVRVSSLGEAEAARRRGEIPLLLDAEGRLWPGWSPDALVDARMRKGGHGLSRESAPCVIGLGPGFTAGVDCHAVVETLRGHDLGRVWTSGSARADTGVPGELGGESARRVVRSPAVGIFQSNRRLGASLQVGDEVGTVAGLLARTDIAGLLRGLIRPGSFVRLKEKIADVDPRGAGIDPRTVSDRSLAVGGGVLEALLRLAAEGRERDGRTE